MAILRRHTLFCVGSINLDFYRIPTTPNEHVVNKSTILEERAFLGGSASNTAYFINMLSKSVRMTEIAKKSNPIKKDSIKVNSIKENPIMDEYMDNILGINVFLMGIVGSDSNGTIILNRLENRQMDATHIMRVEGLSGRTDIILDESGEKTIIRHETVSNRLYNHLDFSKIREGMETGYAKTHVKSDSKTIHEILKITGKIFSADISGFCNDREIFSIFRENEAYEIEILFGNEEEFSDLIRLGFGVYDPEVFAENPIYKQNDVLHKIMSVFNSSILCMKRGRNGAILLTRNELYETNAFEVMVVDTTGAGDAFNAGFIYGILTGKGPKESLEYACALGSLNCTLYGAQNLKITLNQLALFIGKGE